MGDFFGRHKASLEEGKTLAYTVLRKNETGEFKEIVLQAPIVKVQIKQRHLLSFDEQADAAQLALRKSWLTAQK